MGLSSSREEQERPPVRTTDTGGRPRPVKPVGALARAEPSPARDKTPSSAENGSVWEQVFARSNLFLALDRVEKNAGAPGSDGLRVDELRSYLKDHWLVIRASLDAETYRPQPVRRVAIPKPDGGVRQLGIPTVLDRLIQQALAQALTPLFEPRFSAHSYGFRPGRSAHQAVTAAQAYIQDGYDWVVDIDLEKFFERVNHDMLMARVARVVTPALAGGAREDKRVLRLIRRYLESGVLVNGVVHDTEEGTPQGGPLSPLLANSLLDDLDQELERRGHRFVRYADDCNIYVQSQRAGERVLASVRQFLEQKLKLKVNEKKSAVAKAGQRKFLGFSFFKRDKAVWVRIAPQALDRMKEKLRHLTRRTRSGTLDEILERINRQVVGWVGYFRLADTPSTFHALDEWLRRRLRQLVWKRWKRGKTRWRELVKLGVSPGMAGLGAVGTSPWHMAASPVVQMALSNTYFRQQGLASMAERYRQLRRT
jgi:RNA-directed DNA polymerase